MPSTLQLAAATTFAIHLIAAVVIDAIGVVSKEPPRPPPVRVSVVDLDLKRMRPRPEPPTPAPVEPVVAAVTREQPQPSERRRVAARTRPVPSERRPNEPPPDTIQPSGGGDPLYRLPTAFEGGNGPKVALGQRQAGPTGDGGDGGGSGGGSGGGEGAGSGRLPTSIVSIKIKARPRGNFDYFDAGKTYPADARRLGVEGVIKAKLVVDATGKVTKVTLVTKLGHGLDQLATTRGFALEFDPARDGADRPVTSVVVWEFTFTLPK